MSCYRLEKQPKDDAGGFFGDNTIAAGSCCRLANQLVHIAPPSAGWAPAPYLKDHLGLGKAERQAIGPFDLQSPGKCCSLARAGHEQREKYRKQGGPSTTFD